MSIAEIMAVLAVVFAVLGLGGLALFYRKLRQEDIAAGMNGPLGK